MKRKLSGLISLGIVLLAVGAAYLYYDYGFWQTSEPVSVKPMQPLAAVWVPDQATIKEMKRLERHLGQLVHPPQAEARSVDLMLFGYHSMNTPHTLAMAESKKLPIDMEYALSFTFVSNTQRICMIDGVFYSPGARLPDGGKILKIEPKRVLIQKKRFTKWVDTEEMKEKADQDALKNPKESNPS